VDPGKLLADMRERQIAWMSDAQIGNVHALRACISSFKTTEREINWVVDQMNSLVANVACRKIA
jgi:hypothetical protein